MINFIKNENWEMGAGDLAASLTKHLKNGERVVWTLPGGSNEPISVAVLKMVREKVERPVLKNLVIMQGDERYGEIGHPDSNWKQLKDLGFETDDTTAFPMLVGLSLEDSEDVYSRLIEEEFDMADAVIGQFGMGADGHIAGLLPHTPPFRSDKLISGYQSETFIRITLTPKALRMIDEAFVFVFGGQKKEAIQKLKLAEGSVEDLPALILREIPSAHFYSDLI